MSLQKGIRWIEQRLRFSLEDDRAADVGEVGAAFPEDEAETEFVIGAQGGPPMINFSLGQTYTFDDTAKLRVLPGRIFFYRVRLVP